MFHYNVTLVDQNTWNGFVAWTEIHWKMEIGGSHEPYMCNQYVASDLNK